MFLSLELGAWARFLLASGRRRNPLRHKDLEISACRAGKEQEFRTAGKNF